MVNAQTWRYTLDIWGRGLFLTSTVQLFAGDYIAQDVSIGFTGFLPAELQGVRT